MIASIIPPVAIGHSLQIAHLDAVERSPLLGALNSFALDYVARQKLGGVNFTYGFMKQLPIPRRKTPVWVYDAVEELLFTAWDMNQVFGGSTPFVWNDLRRQALRMCLDVYFAYELGCEEDIVHIMDSFEVMRNAEIRESGDYETERMLLSLIQAGDPRDAGQIEDLVAGELPIAQRASSALAPAWAGSLD